MITFGIFIILAYFVGSVSSAIIVCKIMGLTDPRTSGSKNPGTTNVLRIGGKKAAVLTLLGDALKGFIPVIAAKLLGVSGIYLGFVAFAAFIGHLFPIWFRFQGGKGVATSLGVGLALSWLLGVMMLVTWLLMVVIFRYSSLAALVAAALTPIYSYYFIHPAYLSPICLMSIILILRHRSNIKRLVKGEESKISLGKKVS